MRFTTQLKFQRLRLAGTRERRMQAPACRDPRPARTTRAAAAANDHKLNSRHIITQRVSERTLCLLCSGICMRSRECAAGTAGHLERALCLVLDGKI
jgi:hypothetical protein